MFMLCYQLLNINSPIYFRFPPEYNTQTPQNIMPPRTQIIRTLCVCDCKRIVERKFSRLPNLQNLQNCLFLEELNWLSNPAAE